jgi:hypothetical protein
MNRFMGEPAQSRCLDFADQAQAIKAFSHGLDPNATSGEQLLAPRSGRGVRMRSYANTVTI